MSSSTRARRSRRAPSTQPDKLGGGEAHAPPQKPRPKSWSRSVRKSAAKLSGVHHFFEPSEGQPSASGAAKSASRPATKAHLQTFAGEERASDVSGKTAMVSPGSSMMDTPRTQAASPRPEDDVWALVRDSLALSDDDSALGSSEAVATIPEEDEASPKSAGSLVEAKADDKTDAVSLLSEPPSSLRDVHLGSFAPAFLHRIWDVAEVHVEGQVVGCSGLQPFAIYAVYVRIDEKTGDLGKGAGARSLAGGCEHRYREFAALHQSLAPVLAKLDPPATLALPPKAHKKTSAEVVAGRSEAFNAYVTELLERKELRATPQVAQFLGLAKLSTVEVDI